MKTQLNFADTTKTRPSGSLGRVGSALKILSVLACWLLFSVSAGATCHGPNSKRSGVSPASLSHLQAPALASSFASSPDDADPPIVGLWMVNFYSEGQIFDQGFDQWHADGTEILIDNALPQPANGTGSACLGVYKKAGPRAYSLKHPFWVFDASGNLVGAGLYLEHISVEPGGNDYNGTFTFKTFDLSGNQTFEASGNVIAKRITVDD